MVLQAIPTTRELATRPLGTAFLPEMPAISAEDIEQALTIGDISKMPAEVRVRYYLAVCASAGLNALTRPFTPMKTQSGEVILYANKDCAEQLRAKHQLSIRVLGRERMDDLFIVTVEGRLPSGRSEETQGIVDLTGLKGAALANAIMKAETKAKRRVTLALCGLGFPVAEEGEGHPVRVDLQTGELLDAVADETTRQPLAEREPDKGLAEHTADLFGDAAPVQPAAPGHQSGHAGDSLVAAMGAVFEANGQSPAQFAAFCARQAQRFGKGSIHDLSVPCKQGLLKELREYAARKAVEAAQGAPSAADSSAESGLPDAAPMRGDNEASATRSPDDWRQQLMEALPELKDLTLAQQASSMCEDPDSSADEGNAMLTTVLDALRVQDLDAGADW